jgi:hypothetical protein
MQTEMIEAPDDSSKESSNVEVPIEKVAEATETQKVEETPAVEAEETPKEAPEESIDFKGQKIPVSKIDQLLKDYENDSKWKARNQAESEAVKKQRSELAQLEFLKTQIEQRPDVIQALLTPQKTRDFDAEYRELFSKRPDPLDSENYSRWEMAKDQVLYEKATNDVLSRTTTEASKRVAIEQANALERKGYEDFVGGNKVSADEFKEMTDFISKNIRPVNDRYPNNSYELAYKILHEDKWLESIKADAAKKSIAPLMKATVRNADAGIHKPQVQTTEEDDANDDFVKSVRANHKGKWIPIPQ